MLLIIQFLALWRKNYVRNSNAVEFLIKKGTFVSSLGNLFAVKIDLIGFLLENRWSSLTSSYFWCSDTYIYKKIEGKIKNIINSYYMYRINWKYTIYIVFSILSNSSIFSDTEIQRGRGSWIIFVLKLISLHANPTREFYTF